ncbi:MAG: Asp-tRNA(Asn)/Glu-tRNA(Gln) amidotransferase subunit GatC [Planctomycetes bacterium]|nr:Asp-tRNA(Asn)/Glu-tRNA(Gln) amidotransferase subunit GatC [Planctomycetota bacterium]
MDINDKLIDHLCFLSRLSLSTGEKNSLKADLSKILAYVETVKQVDVTGIEPMVHPAPVHRGGVHSGGAAAPAGIFRDDQTRHNSLGNDKALQNAPKRRANFFEVPRVIE